MCLFMSIRQQLFCRIWQPNYTEYIKKQTFKKKNIWYEIPKLEIIKYSQTRVTPVIADSIVVAVVVGSSNSLQLFSQQVSVKPGGDRQHPAAVAPHVDVHLWHLCEIQLQRRHGRNINRKPLDDKRVSLKLCKNI